MNRKSRIGAILFCFALCGAAAIVQRTFEIRRLNVRPVELYDTVYKQVTAFREADLSRAYQQVSSGFQERFNVEAFARLVKTDYPTIVRAERIEFGNVRCDGHHAVVQAYFFLPDGEVVPCVYSLVYEENTWKIDGARVQKRWPPGRRMGGMRS